MNKPDVRITGLKDPIQIIGVTCKHLIQHGQFEKANEFKNRAFGKTVEYVRRLVREYVNVV